MSVVMYIDVYHSFLPKFQRTSTLTGRDTAESFPLTLGNEMLLKFQVIGLPEGVNLENSSRTDKTT